jgi:hypothetical protein
MSFEDEQALRPELGPGEKLLWAGRPLGGIRLRAGDALMVPFSLMWGGFAIFWELMVIRANAPPLFRLWGIPFVLIGLYLIVGRFFVDAYLRGRTVYGLTNQRAIIASGLFSRQTRSLPLRSISDMTLTERDDRTGTITLGPSIAQYSRLVGSGWPVSGRYQGPAFDLIEDVRSVYDRIRAAQEALPAEGHRGSLDA